MEETNQNIRQFSLTELVVLHLLPGALTALVYSFLVKTVASCGYPKIVALGISALLVIVPLELICICLYSKRNYRRYSIKAAIPYRKKISLKDYLLLIGGLLVWSFIIFYATGFIGEALLKNAFSWLPEWYILNDILTEFPKDKLIMTFIISLAVAGIIVPVTEELYFKGFLLPRMEKMGKAAPFVNTLLFTLYHFWSPWQIVTRLLAITPAAYTVRLKKNINIGIIVHCLINITGDSLFILMLLLKTA